MQSNVIVSIISWYKSIINLYVHFSGYLKDAFDGYGVTVVILGSSLILGGLICICTALWIRKRHKFDNKG